MSGELRIIWGLHGSPSHILSQGITLRRPVHLAYYSASAILKSLILFEQQAPYFHFVLCPLNYVAGDVFSLSHHFYKSECIRPFSERREKIHRAQGQRNVERKNTSGENSQFEDKNKHVSLSQSSVVLTTIYGNTMCLLGMHIIQNSQILSYSLSLLLSLMLFLCLKNSFLLPTLNPFLTCIQTSSPPGSFP